MSGDVERCPIRVGDPCSLCHPGASGPATCGLVYLVMCDTALREELLERWEAWTAAHASPTAHTPASLIRRDRSPGSCAPAPSGSLPA